MPPRGRCSAGPGGTRGRRPVPALLYTAGVIDPVLLRENPDVLKRSQEARGDSVELVDEALEADRVRRAAITEAERLRAEQNAFGKTVAKAPKDEKAAEILKKRTLTNLYNQRPAWLDHAHARLDAAVAEAYGWGEDWQAGRLGDEVILARLFALNQVRSR